MKPLVIYHANCTDGFGAAYAAWTKLGDQAEYLPMNYGEALPNVDGRDVYILDFSFSKEITQDIMDRCAKFVWLDHHKTAFENWCDYDWSSKYKAIFPEGKFIELDNERSGALIAWEYFNPDVAVPVVIRHIDDRDRWQWKINGSKEIHAALQSLRPWTFESWKENFSYEKYGHLIQQGQAIQSTLNQQIRDIAAKACTCRIDGAVGLSVNSMLNISEVGNELAKVSGTYALVWYLDGNTKRANCSLRSIGDYDVSKIASKFGGGGHKNAAGFNVRVIDLMEWVLQ